VRVSARLALSPTAGGGSPALRVVCPICESPVGVYCKKPDGTVQVISHRARSRKLAGCEFPQHCYRGKDGVCLARCGEPGGGSLAPRKP